MDDLSHRSKSPFDTASCISQIFLFWMWPILKDVKRGTVSEASLTALPKVSDIAMNTQTLRKAWEKQEKKQHPSFFRAIFRAFGGLFFRWGFPQVLALVSQMGIALIVSEMINWLKDPTADNWYGYLLASLMLIAAFTVSASNNFVLMRFFILGGLVKQSCLQLLYEKTLRLSVHSLQKTSSGKLINLVASDLDLFEYMVPLLVVMFLPVLLIIAAGFLWMKLQYAGLLAVGLTLAQLPVQRAASYLLMSVRRQIAEATDNRLKLLNNMIEGIKLIKLYAWELPLMKMIMKVRHQEYLNMLKKFSIRLVWFTIFTCGHGITFLFTFWFYIWLGNDLQVSDLMGAMTIVLSLHFYICSLTSYGIDLLSFMRVSCQRMTSVLTLPEMEDQRHPVENDTNAVEIIDLSATWTDVESNAASNKTGDNLVRTSEDMVTCTLYRCAFNVKRGELCMVVGPVGSGKSSLLMALLSELKFIEGRVNISGDCAYVEQEPWIISATARDNILMGKPYNPEHYEKTVQACCLQQDFNSMTHGDLTSIGDRGINLSGGQRARISLARAVYSDFEVYLLDDPLSAVDAHVSAALFEKCISGVLSSKTRVLVTHQTQFLPKADKVVVMKQGTIVAVGTYQELLRNPSCIDVFEEYQKHEESEEEEENVETKPEVVNVDEKKQDKQTIAQEERDSGGVPYSLYARYLYNSYQSYWVFFGLLIVSGGVILLYLAIPFWLQYWASQLQDEQKNIYYVEVLGYLVLGLLFAGIIRNAFVYTTMLRASKRTHNEAVSHVVQTAASFFDANPSGRIMNRLSRDVGLMDDALVVYTSDMLQYIFMVAGGIVVMIVLNPYTLIALALVVVIVTLLVKKVVPVARDIRRVELVTKSPIFSLLTQSIGGLPTIRAFRWKPKFASDMLHATTQNLRAFFHFQAQMRVFQMYTDYSCVILIIVNAYVIISLKGTINPYTIGIGLSFSVMILALMSFLCKFVVEVENIMTCTQRLLEYSKLKPEGVFEIQPFEIRAGAIEFKHVFMKYREHLEFVLKDLSFSIVPKTKVGIVGRTGAGKSSLLQVLFRLTNISEGAVLIDGCDIATLGLHDLRRQLSVIPQSPFIFHGTVRENLDPFGERMDEEIWEALAAVELQEYFGNLKNQLETHLSGSIALSVGQKQLMCLARAVLRRNSILVMDEATANVDKMTDALIQTKIRERFGDCTILTIAHRLKTIIDYDTVMVMDQGTCKEFDSPRKLLERRESEFAKMVEATGPEESRLLRQLAFAD